MQGTQDSQTILKKKTELEDSHIPISELTIQSQYATQYGTGLKINMQNNGMELRVQRQTRTLMVKSLQECQLKQFNGKSSLYNKCSSGQLDIHVQKIKLDLFLTLYTKIN